jgi:hypothetical protein
LNDNHPDIRVPRELLKKLNLPFHIVNPYQPVDKDFEKIYFENHAFASRYFLPHIYNYYNNYGNRVNLPGNNAMAEFPLFKLYRKNITADFLADIIKVKQFEFARKYYAQWLSASRDYCLYNNMNLLILFYWEERLTNWGAQIQIEKDIAQEDFNPFNSRLLIKYYLSAKFENNAPPNFNLSKQIIRNLWPETLNAPFNPSFRHNTAKVFKVLGILETTNKLKSRFVN